MYFPVNTPGALLYMGDGHAAMGDATRILNEMVDPNFVVVASIEKRYLPARRPPASNGD